MWFWHKLSPETRAAFPSYQSGDISPVWASWALWASALGSLLCGVCLERDAGLEFSSSCAWQEGQLETFAALFPLPFRVLGGSACSSSGMLCPWHTLDSPRFLLQESRGVAERTRIEEGREEALEM